MLADRYGHPEALTSTQWLAEHLDDPSVRVIDARFDLKASTAGTLEAVPGLAAYSKGHIPGAVFINVMADLSDPENLLVVVPSNQFEALMGRLGINNDTTVVLYDDRGGTWAARLWWALRYYGHEKVKLLDGGLTSWLAEGRSMDQGVVEPQPAVFRAQTCPELRVDADDVMRAIGRLDTCIVDALPEVFFSGEACLYPGHRVGHIPTAHNVPAPANLDRVTQTLLPASELARLWEPLGIQPEQRVITYCGGGVFAAFALFTLYVMGHENAALYDASWMEWGADPKRPIETGVSNKVSEHNQHKHQGDSDGKSKTNQS